MLPTASTSTRPAAAAPVGLTRPVPPISATRHLPAVLHPKCAASHTSLRCCRPRLPALLPDSRCIESRSLHVLRHGLVLQRLPPGPDYAPDVRGADHRDHRAAARQRLIPAVALRRRADACSSIENLMKISSLRQMVMLTFSSSSYRPSPSAGGLTPTSGLKGPSHVNICCRRWQQG